jgi:hypothetical protein
LNRIVSRSRTGSRSVERTRSRSTVDEFRSSGTVGAPPSRPASGRALGVPGWHWRNFSPMNRLSGAITQRASARNGA